MLPGATYSYRHTANGCTLSLKKLFINIILFVLKVQPNGHASNIFQSQFAHRMLFSFDAHSEWVAEGLVNARTLHISGYMNHIQAADCDIVAFSTVNVARSQRCSRHLKPWPRPKIVTPKQVFLLNRYSAVQLNWFQTLTTMN